MTNLLKTLLATTTVSILMAGSATAQDAQQDAPAPDAPMAEETVETLEAPMVDIYATETIDSESEAQSTLKVVEEVEAAGDDNTIEASSETDVEAEIDVEVETEIEADDTEETDEPDLN